MTGRANYSGVLMRAVLVGSAVVAVTALVIGGQRYSATRGARDTSVRAIVPTGNEDVIDAPQLPISAEASVFRTNAAVVAIDPNDERHRGAHPRNVRTYRVLRAYPGAPPRIPHGFTAAEFRSGACRTCHERGGYSPRFGAYVPLTPHPEMGACLQCHVGNDAVTGVALPSADPSARCLQCHVKSSPRLRDVRSADEQQVTWPSLAPKGTGTPPPIPHASQWRFNCVTCHSGPSAVAEIRIDHPERVDCRSCHVAPLDDSAPFTRTTAPAARRGSTQ